MGAHNFHDRAHGNTPGEAYRAAVEQAHYEYGHDAYNGTISTTSGTVTIPFEEGETLTDWVDRVIEDGCVQKWENCACANDPEDDGLWHFAGWAAC